MEKINVTVSAEDNILEIKPEDEMKDNSTYIIKIKGLKSADGSVCLPDKTFEITTKITPMYCTLDSLRALVDTFGISDHNLLSYIQIASKTADFVSGGKADEESFAVEQFTRTKAVLDCLLHGCMEKTSSGGATFKLGDAEIIDATNSNAFKHMIKLLQDDLQKWQDAIRGYYNEGRCAPKATRFGVKSSSNQDVSWTTVDTILNDLSRSVAQWA